MQQQHVPVAPVNRPVNRPPNRQSATTNAEASRRALESVALLGAAVLVALPAARGIARRWRIRHPKAKCEPAIDKSLKDTYPASDPPAQRYVDIPINRR